MTGYHLRLGYNANGYSGAWSRVLAECANLRSQPDLIVKEACRVEEDASWEQVAECADTMREGAEGCAVTILEDEIMLLASGSGHFRKSKEAARRAFCRLMMERMHAQGVELNLIVA